MAFSDLTPAMQHWLHDPMSYAVQQEIDGHDQALWQDGELAMFVLMWTIIDFTAGRVARCPVCYVAYGRTAEAYGQPSRHDCPSCYGTTFDGGFKAKIIRPCVVTDATENRLSQERHGEFLQDPDERIQSTSDFLPNSGDYVFRSSGERFRIYAVSAAVLHTGFEFTSSTAQAVGFTSGRLVREEESSPAYLIPPDGDTLRSILATPVNTRYPPNLSAHEIIRGPLLP